MVSGSFLPACLPRVRRACVLEHAACRQRASVGVQGKGAMSSASSRPSLAKLTAHSGQVADAKPVGCVGIATADGMELMFARHAACSLRAWRERSRTCALALQWGLGAHGASWELGLPGAPVRRCPASRGRHTGLESGFVSATRHPNLPDVTV